MVDNAWTHTHTHTHAHLPHHYHKGPFFLKMVMEVVFQTDKHHLVSPYMMYPQLPLQPALTGTAALDKALALT